MVESSKKKEKDTKDKFKTSDKKPQKKAKSVDPCQEELQSLKTLLSELEDQKKYFRVLTRDLTK